MAEDSKTYVFDSASKGSLDPNTLLAMMGNNGGFGGNGGWMWIIFLFFLYGWRGNGFFGNGSNGSLGNELNNDFGRDLLLQAINGNGNAISALSTTLNCDINAVQTAINAVQSSVASVGNQVGMSGMQVINAIQSPVMFALTRLEQPSNKEPMFVTADVSRPVRSTEVRPVHL